MKIIKPYEAVVPLNPLAMPGDRGTPAWLVEFRLERKLRPYIALSCDHYTTWAEQEFYGLWRPAKKTYYCDECGKWVKAKQKPKAKPTPTEPMF